MLPTDPRQVAECYTFLPADLDLIAQYRGDQNRLGFAVQLGFLRYPRRAWTPAESSPSPCWAMSPVNWASDRTTSRAAPCGIKSEGSTWPFLGNFLVIQCSIMGIMLRSFGCIDHNTIEKMRVTV
jgi:hypothetical protein